MTRQTVVATDANNQQVCPECYGSGVVDPWAEDAEYPCPACRFHEYASADEYFEISDALARDGMSDARVARAEVAAHAEKRTPSLEVLHHWSRPS